MSKKINKLRIINYNQISDIEIIPSDNTITITGENGQGKTSVLQSINSLVFGGTLDEPVIKTGQKRSDIIAEIDNYIIKWRKTQNSPPQVEIRNKENNDKIGTTRAVISEILGAKIFIDPLSLVNEKDSKKQRKMFIDLLELNTTELDNAEKYQRDKRTDISREIKRLDGHSKTLSFNPDVKRVNTIELVDQLNAANKNNQDIIDAQSDLKKKKKRYKDIQGKITELEKEVSELKSEADTVRESGKEIELYLKTACPIDTSIIDDQLSKADDVNEIVRNNIEYEKTIKEREDQETLHTEVTEKIKSICRERNQLLESKNLSSLNLSITPDAILWNDLPVSKASTGQKIKLGFDFLIMLDPEFGVFWIEDGDKLDNKNYELIKKLAKEKNIQVWIESVSRLKDDNVIVLEGGRIIKGGDTGNGNTDVNNNEV